MKKAKIICNPSSGRQTIQRKVDYLCNLLINDGYVVGKFNGISLLLVVEMVL